MGEPVRRPNESGAIEVAPILVLAGRNGELALLWNLLKWIGENGTYTSSVMMMSTPSGLEVLKRRVARRLDAEISDAMQVMTAYAMRRV